MVVTADNQLHGTVNVSSVVATSQTNPQLLDGATDTTTVLDDPIDFDGDAYDFTTCFHLAALAKEHDLADKVANCRDKRSLFKVLERIEID